MPSAATTPDRTAERLQVLLDVARTINASLELDQVLAHILDRAREILDAESGSVMLVDHAAGNLRVVAAEGPRAHRIRNRRQPFGEGIAGWVAAHGEPVLLHGPAGDLRFQRVCERQDVRDALCAPLQVGDEVLGVISLNNRRGEGVFSEDDLELIIALSHHAAQAIRNARAFEQIQQQQQTLERLLAQLRRAQEEERARIALQLHDGPAQTMLAALRNLEATRAAARRGPASVAESMSELERSIRRSIDETRAVMIDLRPLSLDDIGLHRALEQYARQFEQRTGIRAQVVRRGRERRLPGMLESSFYRIAQEALTNVWKHADAREAWVTLEVRDRTCSLEIRDNGKGCDPARLTQTEGEHLGMTSLRERAELVGGSLTVRCEPGGGTVIHVKAPLAGAPA